MAPERKGGLGRGLAALIPSAPAEMDKSGKTGAIGNGASDIIFGTQGGSNGGAGSEGKKGSAKSAPASQQGGGSGSGSKSEAKKRTTKATKSTEATNPRACRKSLAHQNRLLARRLWLPRRTM